MDDKNLRKIYPFTPRNLELQEFYKQKEEENWAKTFSRKLTLKDLFFILAIIVGSLLVMISVVSLKTTGDLRSRAAENMVNFYLYPKEIILKNKETVTFSPKLVIPGNKKISSAVMAIQFDPQVINLQRFHVTSINDVQLKFQSTSIEKANQVGLVKILLESKSDGSNLSGIINFPQIQFISIKEKPGIVSFVPSESKVVFINGSSAQIQTDQPSVISSLGNQ